MPETRASRKRTASTADVDAPSSPITSTEAARGTRGPCRTPAKKAKVLHNLNTSSAEDDRVENVSPRSSIEIPTSPMSSVKSFALRARTSKRTIKAQAVSSLHKESATNSRNGSTIPTSSVPQAMDTSPTSSFSPENEITAEMVQTCQRLLMARISQRTLSDPALMDPVCAKTIRCARTASIR